jgi:hypothetical protein
VQKMSFMFRIQINILLNEKLVLLLIFSFENRVT